MSLLRFAEADPLDVFNAYRVAWSGDDADTIWDNATKKGVISRGRKHAQLPVQPPALPSPPQSPLGGDPEPELIGFWRDNIELRYEGKVPDEQLQRMKETLPRFFECFPGIGFWATNDILFDIDTERKVKYEIGIMNSVFQHARESNIRTFGRSFATIADECVSDTNKIDTTDSSEHADEWNNQKENLALIGLAISKYVYSGSIDGGKLKHFDGMMATVKSKASTPP